jgi:ubiquinone/menaquinone biosynthesis C-methylase UbiE
MKPELSFRTDLYRGTAFYYDRFRPPYPEALFDDLCRRLPLSGAGQLLDLACGTGQIAFPLAARFGDVWAVDQEPGLVTYGQAKADAAGVTNIRWLAASAETVTVQGPFELVAVGNAFHRLDRPAVARRIFSWLQPGGGVALVWAEGPWSGEQSWQQRLAALFAKWQAELGVTDRVPNGWEAVMERHPHEQVLAEAGFAYVGRAEFMVEQTWTVESLIGIAYSTSFLNREVVGDRADAFERDLIELWHSQQADGVLRERARYAYQLALKA